METAPIISPVPVEILALDQDEVVEGLREKVKGLEKQFQTDSLLLKDLEKWLLD